MKYSRLMVGAALAAILGSAAVTAFAAPNTPKPLSHHLSRAKLFDQYDLNKDGKITQAEINKVLEERFAAATGGASTMSKLQFANLRLDAVRKLSDRGFSKVDWNGDGKISQEEFLNAERARFNRMDRQASGEVSCAPRGKQADKDGDSAKRGHFGHRYGPGASFCATFDTNKDGKVTRAEFDAAVIAMFNKNASNGGLTRDTFYKMAAAKVEDKQDRRFARLDTNHDGKLTAAEFGAPQQKLFSKLDVNKDGVITRDEIAAARHRFMDRMHGWKDGKPGEQSPG